MKRHDSSTLAPCRFDHLQTQKSVALVVSQFHSDITMALYEGACSALKQAGFSQDHLTLFKVPGAFEIPFLAQQIARSSRYQGIVALGCVIRGDTPHFDYVCDAVTNGCLRVSLDSHCPVAFGVLTVDTLSQAQQRSWPDETNKGYEAAQALCQTLEALAPLQNEVTK